VDDRRWTLTPSWWSRIDSNISPKATGVALVLPSYDSRKGMGDDARRMIRHEPLTEQALMSVPTSLTDRSIDIDTFVAPEAHGELSRQFRTLESLEL
jgi:hypothetical protein